MKKYISILATLAVLTTSCDTKFLEANSSAEINSGNMWSSESQCEAGMAALTYCWRKPTAALSYCHIRWLEYSGLNRPGIEALSFTSIYFTGTSNKMPMLSASYLRTYDVQLWDEWSMMYTTIHACNDAIENLPEDVLGTSTYQRYLCDCYILRAFCYSRLNKLFGGVPLYLEPVSNEECNKTQNTYYEVWDQVIEDCTFAIENEYCPDNTLTSYYGSPNRGMAYAIRGTAYLWLAANKGPEASFPGEELEAFTDSQCQEYFALAAADFEAVADCGYSLWDGDWADLFLEDNEQNCEMIYPLQFTSTEGYSTNWLRYIGVPDHYNATQVMMPNPDFVNYYQWADGTEFDFSQVFPGWDDLTVEQREVFFLRDSLHDTETIQAQQTTNTRKKYYTTLITNRDEAIERIGEDIYDEYYLNIGNEARCRTAYDGRDPRLDATVCTPYSSVQCFNDTYNTEPITKVLRWPLKAVNRYDNDADIYPSKRTTFFYFYKKALVTDERLAGLSSPNQQDGTDWPLIRYTQVYLHLAECYANLGRLSDAKVIVDEIRARAGMPEITLGTQEEMIEAIRYELRVELCSEGQNYFDEIRWGTWSDMKYQGNDVYGATNVWGDDSYVWTWYRKDGYWPWSVVSQELELNPNLKERDGWSY